MKKKIFYSLALLLCVIASVKAQVTYSGEKPGKAQTGVAADNVTSLYNNILKVQFKVTGGKLVAWNFEDKKANEKLNLFSLPLFEITLAGDKKITSNDFSLVGKLLAVNGTGKYGGRQLKAELVNQPAGLHLYWTACLSDSSNYVRQIITVKSSGKIGIGKVTMVKLPLWVGVRRVGIVDGSPLIHKNMFFAVEHPMSEVSADKSYMSASLSRLNTGNNGKPFTVSAVWGVTPSDQLRRGFLYYVERERANPYHQVLHYNSWFDISYEDMKLNEKICLDRIRSFGDSLIRKRHVPLNAFLFDDGWDDNRTLWQFNSGFPDGFTNLGKECASYKAGIGVWISPWGGYDEPKNQRLAYGKMQHPPFETNENGFSLSGLVYNKRFTAVTTRFIKDYKVSMFKFDGVGAGNGANGASLKYQKDIDALLQLITEMRQLNPNLYFSLTVGTWPSVYWLKYGDVIWRAGDDTGLAGVGSKRQQWITYRDAQVYKNIVERAPLYPLSSVMSHGICIADHGLPASLEMDDEDVADEIWAFFGTGTSLQELYVNPHKLNSSDWDCLSRAATWAKKRESIMTDVHWTGGDPAKGDVYGYAAWRSGKGVITLRNPSAVVKTYKAAVRDIFEVPAGLTDYYEFYNVRDPKHPGVFEGKDITVSLKPFEVVVMDAVAK